MEEKKAVSNICIVLVLMVISFFAGAFVFQNQEEPANPLPQKASAPSCPMAPQPPANSSDTDPIDEYNGGLQGGTEAKKPCPWKISGVEVGKWGNGRLKDSIWIHGSFPIPPGTSERPDWYINGTCVGKSCLFFNLRRLPGGSSYLNDGQSNTVTVKFTKPPYAGASNSLTFTPDISSIRPGQHRVFK
jgi:hypothetical protein